VMLIRRSPKSARRAAASEKREMRDGKNTCRDAAELSVPTGRGEPHAIPAMLAQRRGPGPTSFDPNPSTFTAGFVAVMPADARSIAFSPVARNPRKVADGPGASLGTVPAP
jgi:hypothetical protein